MVLLQLHNHEKSVSMRKESLCPMILPCKGFEDPEILILGTRIEENEKRIVAKICRIPVGDCCNFSMHVT